MATVPLCRHVPIVMSLRVTRALNHRLVSHFPLSPQRVMALLLHVSGDELAWDRGNKKTDVGNAALSDALVAGEGRQRGR
jgi:hypothetical protein